MFRILRMLRLFKSQRSLMLIFQSFVVSIPALWNISQLLFLIMYMFSVLGMVLFSEVKVNGPMTDTHFQDISSAMLTMLRVSTGENWHELMFSLTRSNHPMYQCIEGPTY